MLRFPPHRRGLGVTEELRQRHPLGKAALTENRGVGRRRSQSSGQERGRLLAVALRKSSVVIQATAETRHTPKFVWRNEREGSREGLRVSHQVIDIEQPWRHGLRFIAHRTFCVHVSYGVVTSRNSSRRTSAATAVREARRRASRSCTTGRGARW